MKISSSQQIMPAYKKAGEALYGMPTRDIIRESVVDRLEVASKLLLLK